VFCSKYFYGGIVPLNTDLVGQSTQALIHNVDVRWLMAYAASLGDLNPYYMDPAAHQVIAHPVLPVCPAWPAILNTREMAGSLTLTAEEGARGVHAAHDLHIYRPIKAGDKISTTSTMVGIRTIKPGAAYTLRLDTCDTDTGELIARTYQLGIYRDVAVQGEEIFIEEPPALPVLNDLASCKQDDIHVPAGAAHTYTECARIWNPIHTDRAVALAAGLPDIILHGTATLALAVSRIVDNYAGANPTRVTRLGGRFSAMVLMPSTITLQTKRADDVVTFQALTEGGQTAISNGFVCLSES